MKCHIPGPNVKVLGRTIHALARFGDELYLESSQDAILFSTLNAAESAYAVVKFNKVFFSYFNYNYYSTEDKEAIKCKISMKSALNAFKSPTHMEKQVENLEIRLEPESSNLIFLVKCKHGILKTHFVSILECKSTQAVYKKDLVPNRITTSQKILTEALGNFQSSDDQVTIEVNSTSFILRNYIDLNIDLTKIIRTQINIRPTEFDSYIIGSQTAITFTLKEFKALLAFSEALSLPLQLQFEVTGKPILFIVHNGSTFEAHFVLATSKSDVNINVTSTQNISSVERKRKEIHNKSHSPVKKKPYLDISKCLNEDPPNYNYINLPTEKVVNIINNETNESQSVQHDICYEMPKRSKMKPTFDWCLEKTFNSSIIQTLVVLADNSDSE